MKPPKLSGAVPPLENNRLKLKKTRQETLPADATINGPEYRTVLLQRTLRSGQAVRYPGNIVIMGDVNPGAEVVAGGSIIVMGKLRGVAHAGAGGRQDAVIFAFRLQPTQLRIGNHITRPPDGEKNAPPEPEIALVRDGTMVIKRYQHNSLEQFFQASDVD